MNSLIQLTRIKKYTDEQQLPLSTYKNRWKSLALSMKFLGLKFEKRFTPHIIFMLIAEKIFTIFFIYENIIILTSTSSRVHWIIFIYFVFFHFVNIFSLYYFHMKKKKITANLNNLYKVSGISSETCTKSRSMLIKVCLVWLNSIVYNVVAYLNIANKKFQLVTINEIFNINSDDYRADIITFGLCFFGNFVIANQFHFLLLYFCSICKDFEYSFVLIRKKIAEKRTPKQINEASFKYMQISAMVNEIESIYSPILFLWSAFVVGNVVFMIGSYLQRMKSSINMTDIITFFCCTGFQLLLFCNVCLSSSNMNREAKKFAMSLYKLSLFINDPSIQQFAFQFSVEILQDLPNFSAWNMFCIDNNLTMTIFSAVVTYGLVMYQFSSKE
ncbi:uncharacterized protein LOC111620676 [Centruroides sculpturatus]|uniref:uncharacterized protein LOC111620676 n=1 Tax=Centruroides sculpturatus TaxID=218467 RepID=UPI000C6CB6D2|nr:uncharacterized protein LOC111620676 [Centruroides sculpturatus]